MASRTFYIMLILGLLTSLLCGCKKPYDLFDATDPKTPLELRPSPQKKQTRPTYCYRTLGAPACYHHPLPGAADRLIAQPEHL